VPFGAFLGSIGGVFACEGPQKRRGSSGYPRSGAPSRCPPPARPAGAGRAGVSSRRRGAAIIGAGANT
jgi:hypothetical protein